MVNDLHDGCDRKCDHRGFDLDYSIMHEEKKERFCCEEIFPCILYVKQMNTFSHQNNMMLLQLFGNFLLVISEAKLLPSDMYYICACENETCNQWIGMGLDNISITVLESNPLVSFKVRYLYKDKTYAIQTDSGVYLSSLNESVILDDIPFKWTIQDAGNE